MESLSRSELIIRAKVAGIKGAAAMKKADLVAALTTNTITLPESEPGPITIRRAPQSEIVCADCLVHLKTLPADSAQIVIADPPYNIGKDFGNDSDKQSPAEYLTWCDAWIAECLRVLKPGGSFYIYAVSYTHLRAHETG
jgi:hypothetical protein